jgi:hypothetical protein
MDAQGGRIFRGLRGPTSTALYAASALRNVRLFVESGGDVNVREEKYGNLVSRAWECDSLPAR